MIYPPHRQNSDRRGIGGHAWGQDQKFSLLTCYDMSFTLGFNLQFTFCFTIICCFKSLSTLGRGRGPTNRSHTNRRQRGTVASNHQRDRTEVLVVKRARTWSVRVIFLDRTHFPLARPKNLRLRINFRNPLSHERYDQNWGLFLLAKVYHCC